MMSILRFFFCKQKTAYEMRISDWSSDVCSSDLGSGTPWSHGLSTDTYLIFRWALALDGNARNDRDARRLRARCAWQHAVRPTRRLPLFMVSSARIIGPSSAPPTHLRKPPTSCSIPGVSPPSNSPVSTTRYVGGRRGNELSLQGCQTGKKSGL